MLINISQLLMAQMESLLVDFVKDLSMGLKPSNAEYISTADFAVASRRWFRLEKGEFGA